MECPDFQRILISYVPTYYVSETARKNVTVSLSGVGGDMVRNGAASREYLQAPMLEKLWHPEPNQLKYPDKYLSGWLLALQWSGPGFHNPGIPGYGRQTNSPVSGKRFSQ